MIEKSSWRGFYHAVFHCANSQTGYVMFRLCIFLMLIYVHMLQSDLHLPVRRVSVFFNVSIFSTI